MVLTIFCVDILTIALEGDFYELETFGMVVNNVAAFADSTWSLQIESCRFFSNFFQSKIFLLQLHERNSSRNIKPFTSQKDCLSWVKFKCLPNFQWRLEVKIPLRKTLQTNPPKAFRRSPKKNWNLIILMHNWNLLGYELLIWQTSGFASIPFDWNIFLFSPYVAVSTKRSLKINIWSSSSSLALTLSHSHEPFRN